MIFNSTKTFKTNDDLYDSFVISCKLKRKKVFERINELIASDVKSSAHLSVVPEPVLFEDVETPAETEVAPGV